MSANSQTKINHVSVYVKDLKVSSQFYEETVGIKKIEEPFKDGLHTWFEIGEGISLHLIERETPWTNPSINKTNHLCFSVSDLNKFIERLAEEDISFEDAPGKKGEINIRPDGVKQIYIQDPDGYWLEINDEF
ncbi:MAG: VOC family protein [Cyclobacteriaceae bacterium]